jgi:hypothetical protein
LPVAAKWCDQLFPAEVALGAVGLPGGDSRVIVRRRKKVMTSAEEHFVEKLRIRLQRPIPGVDALSAIDAERFAEFHSCWDHVAEQLDVDRINDFYVYEGEYGKNPGKWHRASKGLTAVRAILEYYRLGKGSMSDEQRQATIELFEAVESILGEADLRDIRFCFVGDY